MTKQSRSIARVALPLMAATLLSTPAFAQDAAAPVQVTPPAAEPVAVTPPQAAPQASTPAPASQTTTSTASGVGDRQSATPINAEAAAAAEAESQESAAAARQQRATRAAPAQRRAAAPRAAAETPAAAAPVATPAPAPVAQRAAPVAATPQPAPAAAAPEAAQTAQTTQRTETTGGTPTWPFVAGALVILAGLAAFLLRRRRQRADEEYWDEPAAEYVEERPMTVEAAPVAAAAAAPAALDLAHEPVAAAVTPDDVSVTDADAEELAALTAGQTVSGRPWLELAMRPLRAGTRADEAMVEIELTVGNAGEVAAEDVRISTFMLTGESDEMERMLIDPPVDSAVEPVTIDAGEGTRVDATLAVPRSTVNGHFQPIVVADARYRLPDGSEGRTSASFLVGVSDEGGTMLQPLDTDRTAMRDDVEARLYREPQRV